MHSIQNIREICFCFYIRNPLIYCLNRYFLLFDLLTLISYDLFSFFDVESKRYSPGLLFVVFYF